MNIFERFQRSGHKICLISKIKGLATEAKRTRVQILRSTDDKSLWVYSNRKRLIGMDARHHLLAYAFLKGTPYHKLEKSCRSDNLPIATFIHYIVMAQDGLSSIYGHSLEDIQKWLKGGV